MEDNGKRESVARTERDDIFSKAVRAGKRTYFFDVKVTRNNDHYLTITESKKRFNDDGTFRYEKHKIFLYKEDFEKFSEGFSEVVAFINKANDENDTVIEETISEPDAEKKFTDVSFEDLDK